MTFEQALKAFESLERQALIFQQISAVLNWDFETSISPKGTAARGEQLAWLEGASHDLLTKEENGEIFSVLKAQEGLDDGLKGRIRILNESYEKAHKVPKALAMELAQMVNDSTGVWFEARKNGDWTSFKPYLEKLISLATERAKCISPDLSVYDAMLDEYEKGFTAKRINSLFDTMVQGINDTLAIVEGKSVRDDFLHASYPIPDQQRFMKLVLSDMGFDFERGVIGQSAHPFTTTLGPDDVRITTRYTEPTVDAPLLSTIHEGGHAIYEMRASNPKTAGTVLASGASMAVHESQSRFWENIVARSYGFWEHYYPVFREIFPIQLKGIDLKTFVMAINRIVPNDIRCNADEVTYGLHIILRFKLEDQLFNSGLKVADLPEAWDELSLKLLGKKPDSISSGVLQDTHWASGLFGYFPSYALGNLLNSQIYARMKKEIGADEAIAQGKLIKLTDYLDKGLYQYGATYEGYDLFRRFMGIDVDASYFNSYLTSKFAELYK